MKKRMWFLPLFVVLLVSVISAPTFYTEHDRISDIRYDGGNNQVETTRVFLIKKEGIDDHYRTFENFNKARVHSKKSYPSRNQRGIYRDFFDTELIDDDHYCDIDCPKGWKCKKTSSK